MRMTKSLPIPEQGPVKKKLTLPPFCEVMTEEKYEQVQAIVKRLQDQGFTIMFCPITRLPIESKRGELKDNEFSLLLGS